MPSVTPAPLAHERSTRRAARQADRPPSFVVLRFKETISLIKRLRHALSARPDAQRIDAHREAVHRELSLTVPPR